jgi:hypothetical protein
VLLRVVVRQRLLEELSGARQLTQTVDTLSHHLVAHKEERRVLDAVGQREELLGQLPPDRVLRTRVIKHPQPKEHLGQLRRFLHLLGQRPRPGIGAPRLGRGIALGGHQRRAEGGPQLQL